MSTPDYSAVMSLLPLDWEADEEWFRYRMHRVMDRIMDALLADGVYMRSADVTALYDAAWSHRAKVLAK